MICTPGSCGSRAAQLTNLAVPFWFRGMGAGGHVDLLPVKLRIPNRPYRTQSANCRQSNSRGNYGSAMEPESPRTKNHSCSQASDGEEVGGAARPRRLTRRAPPKRGIVGHQAASACWLMALLAISVRASSVAFSSSSVSSRSDTASSRPSSSAQAISVP